MKTALVPAVLLSLAAAACTGADAVVVGNSINAVSAAIDPPLDEHRPRHWAACIRAGEAK